MVNTIKLNIVSTIFAIGVYLIILTIFIMIVSNKENKIRYGKDINDSITIDLKELLPSNKNQKRKSIKKIQKKRKKLIKISQSKKNSKQDSRDIKKNSIKNLFSTSRVLKNANAIEEKIKQEKTRASRLKKIKAKELFKNISINKTTDLKEKLLKIKKILNSVKKSSPKGQYDDKYISKISSIILKLWQNTIATQDGLKATVTIRIDRKGHLSYKNIKPSFNELFDTKLKHFLKEISKMKFPPYKNKSHNTYIEAEFIFTDKAKE